MTQALNIDKAYQALGLRYGADRAEVKRAYYRLAKILHPDANPGADGSRMARINLAYRTLLQFLELQGQAWSPFNLQDFSPAATSARPKPEIKRPKAEARAKRASQPPAVRGAHRPAAQASPAWFGPLAPEPQPQGVVVEDTLGWRLMGLVKKGDALVYQVELSGDPASISLPMRRSTPCASCGGKGVIKRAWAAPKTCAACGGRGKITTSGQVEVALPGILGSFEVRPVGEGTPNPEKILVELTRAAKGKV